MTIERDDEIMVTTTSPERAREFLGVSANTPVREVGPSETGRRTVYAIPASAWRESGGRFPVCVECGRCGDSSCNSGCIFCTEIKGARRYLPIPMKLRDSERLVARPKQ